MNSNDDHLSLIENYLDSSNHEYQSHNNQIEIYSLSKNTIIINIKKSKLVITSDMGQYKFSEPDAKFFKKLNYLLVKF